MLTLHLINTTKEHVRKVVKKNAGKKTQNRLLSWLNVANKPLSTEHFIHPMQLFSLKFVHLSLYSKQFTQDQRKVRYHELLFSVHFFFFQTPFKKVLILIDSWKCRSVVANLTNSREANIIETKPQSPRLSNGSATQ